MKRFIYAVILCVSLLALSGCRDNASLPHDKKETTTENMEKDSTATEENETYAIARARIGEDIAVAHKIINDTRTSYSTEKYGYESEKNNYDQLDDKVKNLYDEMKEKADHLEYFRYAIEDGYTYDDLDNVLLAWTALADDYPYYDTYFTITDVMDENGEMTVAFESRYFMPYNSYEEIPSEVDHIKRELGVFEAECQMVVEGMDENWSTYDKYRYLAVFISLRTSYDYAFEAGTESSSGYAAIDGGASICEGYAKAMQYLCEKADLYCIMVSGESNGDAHAWNLVKLDSGTYYVDVTWSDEQEQPGVGQWCEYFMFTEEKAQESRIIWDDVLASGIEQFEINE